VFYTSVGPVRPCIFTYTAYIVCVHWEVNRGAGKLPRRKHKTGTIISSQKGHRRLSKHPGGGGFRMGSGNGEHSSLFEDPARGGVLYQEEVITYPRRGHYSILSGCKWAASRIS